MVLSGTNNNMYSEQTGTMGDEAKEDVETSWVSDENEPEFEQIEHSKNYEKVKGYYDGGYWNEARVANAVVKGWITEGEYKEIIGSEYNS